MVVNSHHYHKITYSVVSISVYGYFYLVYALFICRLKVLRDLLQKWMAKKISPKMWPGELSYKCTYSSS